MGGSSARRVGAAVAAACALAICPQAFAAVVIDGTLIQASQLKTRSFDRSVPGNAGGQVRCAKDKRILNGGAFWHDPGVGPDPAISNTLQLTSSAPLSGRTWYADGRNNQATPRTLTVEVRCLPKRQLGHVVTRTRSKTLASGTFGQVKAGCSPGDDPISGGAFLSEPGKEPKPGVSAERGRITGSTPEFGGWLAIGGNFSNGRLELTAVARCYPEDLFDGSANFIHPSPGAGGSGGGYVACGAARAALTGGASWSATNTNVPDPALATQTFLSGNATTFAADGHYGAGYNASSGTLDLDVIAVCPGL